MEKLLSCPDFHLPDLERVFRFCKNTSEELKSAVTAQWKAVRSVPLFTSLLFLAVVIVAENIGKSNLYFVIFKEF